MPEKKQDPYAKAGVNISEGNAFIEQIKPLVKKTRNKQVIGGLGGFGGLFKLPTGYKEPVLVAGTDGVGTKLKLANALNKHDTIGIDLVAMCVNDLLCQGAKPLFFLDYYATGQLDVAIGKQIVTGIVDGCEQSEMSLLGGETAEMPGVYQNNDFDLAGFAVGIVDAANVITGDKVASGDVVLGLPSSGVHSNGFSLIRKIIDDNNIDLSTTLDGSTLGNILLEPTRIYVKQILPLLKHIHSISHITGGGLTENIPRVIPKGFTAHIDLSTWALPPIFQWIAKHADMSQQDLLRTYNCGIGLVLIVPKEQLQVSIDALKAQGETPLQIGSIDVGSEPITYAGSWNESI